MSNSLINHKENGHNTPMHYGFRNDFNDLVNSFLGGFLDFPKDNRLTNNFSNINLEPKIEVNEAENNVTVCAELPGIPEENIDLEVSSDGYLTISGEKKQEHKENHKGSYFSEFSYGSFKRTIPLPWDLKFDDAEADYNNGILKVIFPKSVNEQEKKKKISIKKK